MKTTLYFKMASSLALCLTMLLLITQSSCVKDVYNEEEKEITPPEKNPTDPDFEFSPITKCTLKINYDLKGQPIPFQIYYENPILDENNTLNESMKPSFAGWTNENGVYSDLFSIPSAIKIVYITTRVLGVPNCVIVNVENNQVNFDMSLSKTKAALRSENTHKITPKMHVLGNWTTSGVPDYLIQRADVPATLLNDILTTLPSVKGKTIYDTNPDYFKPSKVQSVRITQEAEVNLLFITESASMSNSLGYYHYPTGETPTDVSKIERIIALPCANFSGKTNVENNVIVHWGALFCGDQIHLKYWDGKQFQDKFPANTTIELFLLPSAFKRNAGYNQLPGDITESAKESRLSTKYTSASLNKNQNPASVALYDPNRKLVTLGFEDQDFENSDKDFNDAIFTIQTLPETALDGNGMAQLKPGNPLPEEITYLNEGTLAFEDLWPSQGDYDMNDVVVHYKSTLYTVPGNKISKIEDDITVKWNGCSYRNGFGYQLGVSPSVVKSCAITTDTNTPTPGYLETGQSLATIILFNSARELVGTTFNIVTEFTAPQPQANLEPPYNPFIIPQYGDNGLRSKEVHLTNKKPTALADLNLLGTNGDISDISLGRYYISKNYFPFAIYVPGEYRVPKEGVRIDIAYPKFSDWVKSSGTTNQDWYSNPDSEHVNP